MELTIDIDGVETRVNIADIYIVRENALRLYHDQLALPVGDIDGATRTTSKPVASMEYKPVAGLGGGGGGNGN